jgi:hypothetical protein
MLSARRMTISWGLFERSTAGFVYTVCGFRVLRRLYRFYADDICYCRLTAGWVPHLDVSGIFIPCRSRDFCWFLTIEYGFPILNERTDAYDSIRSHEVFRDLTDRGESKIQFDMTRWCGLALPINEWEISPMVWLNSLFYINIYERRESRILLIFWPDDYIMVKEITPMAWSVFYRPE